MVLEGARELHEVCDDLVAAVRAVKEVVPVQPCEGPLDAAADDAHRVVQVRRAVLGSSSKFPPWAGRKGSAWLP